MSSLLRKCGGGLALALLFVECAVLLYSGFTKLGDAAGFAELIGQHGLVSPGWTRETAWLVTLAELLVPVGTLAAVTLRPGTRLAVMMPAVLFGAFGAYAAGLVIFPPPVPVACGCGLGADANSVADWPWIAVRSFAVASVTALSGLLLPAGGAGDASARSADRTQAAVEVG